MPIASPAVSIVLPFRNEAEHVAECLESIRVQTLEEWELLAIDDGSEDGSPAIVRAFAEGDARVRLIQPGRVGLVAALNRGIGEAGARRGARRGAGGGG